MALHTTSIPIFKCFIRKQFMYNLETHFNEFDECVVFGITCSPGQAPLMHCMLPNGAIYYRVPLHAFTTNKDVEMLPPHQAYFWDSFSYYFTVQKFMYLREMGCNVLIKGEKKPSPGTYMFTVDWLEPDGEIQSLDAEIPDENKCHHFIHLDNGNFVAYPNNRILWREPSFIVRDELPDYRTNTHKWNAENDFVTENTDRMFYKTQDE